MEGEGDVGSGYELTRGTSQELMKTRFVAEGSQMLHLTQEFGTQPNALVARAMVLENQAFHFAPEMQPYWSSFTRDAFYVRTEAWKKNVILRGVRVAEQAIVRSEKLLS